MASTLLRFLWQGVAIALAYAAARRRAASSVPNVRYLLTCAALARQWPRPRWSPGGCWARPLLRLEAAKGPVEVIAVDHAERPSVN